VIEIIIDFRWRSGRASQQKFQTAISAGRSGWICAVRSRTFIARLSVPRKSQIRHGGNAPEKSPPGATAATSPGLPNKLLA